MSKYDKNKYKIFLILNNTEEDLTTNAFKELVDESFNIKGLDDIKAINLIRQQNIDIIIDIMGLTSDNRITLLKNRLAPIQISWLGYCNTTGLENMDYIISDQNLIFQDEKNLYTEKIIFLPRMLETTSKNIGSRMAVIFVEKNKYIKMDLLIIIIK